MPRMSDEKRGASLIAARRAIAADRGDVAGMGFLLMLRYLEMGHGEAGDVPSNLTDMMVAVAKHAHRKGVEPEELLQALERPGRPVDDGTVLGGAVAFCDDMRTTSRLSGIPFVDVVHRVRGNLDVEMPRPGM